MRYSKFFNLLFFSLTFSILFIFYSFANEEVIRVDIPDEKGGYSSLYGKDAQLWYESCVNETEKEIKEIQQIEENKQTNIDISLRGPFTYKYRYIEEKRTKDVKREDLKRNITNKLENRSSVMQTYSLSFKVSQSFEINSAVSGKYKDAVLAYLGSSWNKSYEKSETITVNIPPRKSLQVEFIPIMDKSTGYAQKYYKTRGSGNLSKTIVENSIQVITYSPKYTECKVGNKYMKTIYGVYIWKEASL